jgi:hypothetical protein
MGGRVRRPGRHRRGTRLSRTRSRRGRRGRVADGRPPEHIIRAADPPLGVPPDRLAAALRVRSPETSRRLYYSCRTRWWG